MMEIFIIVLVNILFWALAVFILLRKINQRMDDSARLENLREQINQLIIELDQTTERNISLLEFKIEELKKITSKSDKEIQMLQKQKEDYSLAMERYRELGRKENPVRNEEISVKEKETNPPVVEKKEQSAKEQAIELYRQGFSSEDIASSTGLPKGEVELIITMSSLGR